MRLNIGMKPNTMVRVRNFSRYYQASFDAFGGNHYPHYQAHINGMPTHLGHGKFLKEKGWRWANPSGKEGKAYDLRPVCLWD